MRYLIDGYNLLHAIGLLCGRVGPHGLEKARRALLGRLSADHGAGVSAVTIVFDASRAPPGAPSETDYGGIHIHFALDGEADEVIETLIQHDSAPHQLMVVSDDHRIQQAGHRRGCQVRGCLDYLEELERPRRRDPASAEALVKPDSISSEEVQHWMQEFADLAEDTKWREALGPEFRDAPS